MVTQETETNLSGGETSKWHKYVDLEPVRRLRNEGRELLGKPLLLTEKRDGENVNIWLNVNSELKISSHNLIEGSIDIQNRFKATPEYAKAKALLHSELEFNHTYILYGELLKQVSPTRIEPKRKHEHWILFDIWDCEEKHYLSYTMIYQKAYHFKIPIVRTIAFHRPSCMEDLVIIISDGLKWCKRHRREGFVGKNYQDQLFFKEKVDVPKLPKLPRPQQIQLPQMPQEKILRALQHAYDEAGFENWKNVKITMPIVAKHFELEAKEHNYSTPRNMYQLYVNIPLDAIIPQTVKGETQN